MRLFKQRSVSPSVKNITQFNNKFHVTQFYSLSNGGTVIWGSADDARHMIILDQAHEFICQHKLPRNATFLAAYKDYIIYDEGKLSNSRKFKFDFKALTQEEISGLTSQDLFFYGQWLHLENSKFALPLLVEDLDSAKDEKHITIATHDLFKNEYNKIAGESLISIQKHATVTASAITPLSHNKYALEISVAYGSDIQFFLFILAWHADAAVEFTCEHYLEVSRDCSRQLGAYLELASGDILTYGHVCKLIKMPYCEVIRTFNFLDVCDLNYFYVSKLIPLADSVHIIAKHAHNKLSLMNLETKTTTAIDLCGIRSLGFSVDYISDIAVLPDKQVMISFVDYSKNDHAQIFVMDFTDVLEAQNRQQTQFTCKIL